MKRIAIHSVPRSGSTWLGTIFDSHPRVIYKYQPLFSYKFKDYLSEYSSNKRIVQFFDELKTTEDEFLDQKKAKKRGIVPKFKKESSTEAVVYKEVRYHHVLENILSKAEDVKVIGLIRNPLSTIYSWLNAPKEFKKDEGWKVEEEWRFAPKKNLCKPEEFNGYEKWKEVALLFESFQELYPENFMLVKYHDLLSNTEDEVRRIFKFADLKVSAQTMSFLSKSRNKTMDDPYSVYRAKKADNKWKGKLPKDIVSFIKEDLESKGLEKYLFDQ